MIRQPVPDSPVTGRHIGRGELAPGEWLGLAVLMLIFTLFTWRGLIMFFSGDDMMNMYRAWDMDAWDLVRAQVMLCLPVYRPVGDAIYRLFYEVFGFRPAPLYAFCWLLLAGNVIVAHRFFRSITAPAEALTALSLVLVHGSYTDLYYSAGTIYDRLCFLFTISALAVFFRFRRQPNWRAFLLICVFSTLAMGSKESGITLLPILISCECLFFMPRSWNSAVLARWFRQAAPLFAALTFLSVIFLLGRVNRTPGLQSNPAYLPQLGVDVWLARVAEYLSVLTYQHVRFTPGIAAVVLVLMGGAAMLTRSRVMAFGLLLFMISITPVALISPRPGYVLYLPSVGLGLFLSAAMMTLTSRVSRWTRHTGAITFLLITGAVTSVHARNWQPAWQSSPELRLTEQFRRQFPSLPANARLLFASDDFPPAAWDLLFNIRLLYHSKTMIVHRLKGGHGQGPNPEEPLVYDHIFAAASGRYVELDPRDPAESIRLNILRNYPVGREMNMSSADHVAYVVSGLQGEQGERCRWTASRASFKFKPGAAPAVFTTKFWLPDFIAAPRARTLSVLLNGQKIGTFPLDTEGMNEASFEVPASFLQKDGFELIDMRVAHPYRDAEGNEYGLLLCSAGFEHLPRSKKR